MGRSRTDAANPNPTYLSDGDGFLNDDADDLIN